MSASEVATLTTDEIESKVKALGKWFHNIDLKGVKTAPDHFLGDYPSVKFRGFQHAIPEDLTGKSVLDIGCNAGFYSIEMKKRGADRVLAIDSDEDYLKQARFAASVNEMNIEFRKMNVYEVPATTREVRCRYLHGSPLPPSSSLAGVGSTPRSRREGSADLPVDAAGK